MGSKSERAQPQGPSSSFSVVVPLQGLESIMLFDPHLGRAEYSSRNYLWIVKNPWQLADNSKAF